ncbi:M23 family metallopeptidase [Arthrobacter sp. CAU 1506]|nr:M23 family metallopeptidase [Arthrobacter sp. CAU 1506]
MNQTSGFGYRSNPITGAAGELHTGIDYAMGCGTPVNASDGGKVVEAGFQVGGGGNRIVVEHRGGLKTTYNHLQSIGVSLGQKVAQGDRIGELGTTGNSTGCHLHFEVVKDGQTVDPAGWL